MSLPILYSFRRCPYAMRARLSLVSAACPVELREVVLRDKPEPFLAASPKGTVPVLVLNDGTVLEESLDVMHWAMKQSDPEGLRDFSSETLAAMDQLIEICDGPFKFALDRYKYPNRYPEVDRDEARQSGGGFITDLEARLKFCEWLFDDRPSFADLAILPFVRQFAHVDREWFWAQDWPNVLRWLDAFLISARFEKIMPKFAQWKAGEPGVSFAE